MINITKQGNNVIVTSDNPNSFYIGNGELSVPLNTIYYVLDDESDFIQFNSTEKGKILFNGTIGDIQVNGNIVNRDNILMELDNVFNSAATGGEGGTAGVLAINIGQDIQDWTQKTGIVKLYTQMYDGGYEVAADGMSFFGIKPADDTIIIEQGGGTANGCFRGSIKVNPDVLGGGSSEPEQYIVSIEDFWMYTKEEPYKKLWLQYIDSSNKNEIITKEIILEWTGTQSEYDALGEYDDSITYNIIEG